MDALDVPLAAAALLLVVSGVAKLRHPGDTDRALRATGWPSRPAWVRGLGLVEVATGVAVIAAADHPVPPLALALLYAGFAAFVVTAVWKRAPLTSCGCFGAAGVTPTPLHAGIDAGFAAVGLLRALDEQPAPLDVVLEGGADAIVLVVGSIALAGAAYWLFTRWGGTRSAR